MQRLFVAQSNACRQLLGHSHSTTSAQLYLQSGLLAAASRRAHTLPGPSMTSLFQKILEKSSGFLRSGALIPRDHHSYQNDMNTRCNPPARIVIHVMDAEQRVKTTRRFTNPPKVASIVLERLRESGFSGDLQDSEGNSLSSTDALDDTQEYRLTCPTGIYSLPLDSGSASSTLQ